MHEGRGVYRLSATREVAARRMSKLGGGGCSHPLAQLGLGEGVGALGTAAALAV